MKKLSLSLMLNVSLVMMLALSLIYPQSVAVSLSPPGRFWRRLSVWLPVVSGCMPLVCAGTLRAGAAAGVAGREDCHVAVLQPVPWCRRAAALVVMVATFISLVAAGWILLR